MNTVKLLERKWIIRIFGLALILAPFFNLLFLFYTIKSQYQMTWAEVPFKQIMNAGKFSKYLMIFASFVIGGIMLKGSAKAWKAVMALLFFHVVLQVPTIGTDIKQNWMWGPLFLLNVGIFVFIADQLVFRNSLNEVKKTEPAQVTSSPVRAAKAQVDEKAYTLPQKINIDFDRTGSWAELKSISQTGVLLKKNNTPPPENIELKTVDFMFDAQTTIQAQFKFKKGHDYFFEFRPLTEQQSELLNNWLDRKLGS
jgi:hypothetical protein